MDLKPKSEVMAWLGPIILLNIFIWIVAWTPEANAVVCQGSENCLTDWISALSGWAAVGAAYFTVKQMISQREDAIKHQAEFVELETMERLSVVRNVRRELDSLSLMVGFAKQSLPAIADAATAKEAETCLEAAVKAAKDFNESEEWRDYLRRIGSAHRLHVEVLNLYQQVAATYFSEFNAGISKSEWPTGVRDLTVSQIQSFGEQVTSSISRFAQNLYVELAAFDERWRRDYRGPF